MTPRSARRSVVGRGRRRTCGSVGPQALVRKKPATSPTPKLLDGTSEAKLIDLRLGQPPAGFGHWTLRFLADQMVELEIVESISPETVRQTL